MSSLYDRITAATESGGRDYNRYGRPMQSRAGALFKMQVMPSTAHDPGFGIRPAASDTPDEYNRVGHDYLAAMQQRYGNDPAKMWAAYNGGPGRLDHALQSGGGIGAMPAETQGYVGRNMAMAGQPLIQPNKPAPNYSAPQPQDAPLGLSDAPMAQPSQGPSLGSMLPGDPKIPHPKFFSKDGLAPSILGVLGDSLMALSGLQPTFAPEMNRRNAAEQQQGFDREKWQAELQAKQAEDVARAAQPPAQARMALYLNGLDPTTRNSVLSGMDMADPHYNQTTDPQGQVHMSLAPRAGANTRTVNGQTYYLVNGEWYDNPEGR